MNIMIYYKTHSWKIQIDKVEVEKETENSVWINGRRNAKHSRYEHYYRTFEEAKGHFIDKYQRRIESYNNNLSEAYADLLKAQSLTELEGEN